MLPRDGRYLTVLDKYMLAILFFLLLSMCSAMFQFSFPDQQGANYSVIVSTGYVPLVYIHLMLYAAAQCVEKALAVDWSKGNESW